MADRGGQDRPGGGVGQRHVGGRVEVLPAVAGKPDLDPGVGVLGLDLVEVGDRVVRPRHVADGLAGRDAEAAEHDDGGGRDLLAIAATAAEEEGVHGVGPGGQGRDLRGVAHVVGHPRLDGGDLGVGVGIGVTRGADAPGDRLGQRRHLGIGVGELQIPGGLVLPDAVGSRGTVHRRRCGGGFEHRGTDRRVVGHHGVDGPRAHGRVGGDRPVGRDREAAGLGVDPLGVVGVEDQVGAALGQVERLDVLGPRRQRGHLVRVGGDEEG